MTSKYRTYLLSMTLYWLVFGLGAAFYPKMLQPFMSPDGIAASTSFSNHVWFHDGVDILSVCLLLFALSRLPATTTALQLTSIVALLPAVAIVYALFATPYWQPLFLAPAAGCFTFAGWGFALSSRTRTENAQ